MQSHYFEYLGAKLHYQLGGKESAPAMVLLHGGLGSIDDFAALLPRLQQLLLVKQTRTRPDQTHIAQQHIPQLRQLV